MIANTNQSYKIDKLKLLVVRSFPKGHDNSLFHISYVTVNTKYHRHDYLYNTVPIILRNYGMESVRLEHSILANTRNKYQDLPF